MKDASSKRKKNVSISLGIWSVTFCMAAGLALKMRPFVILQRSVLSFAVSAMLGYFLVSVIEKYTIIRKPLVSPAVAKAEKKEQKEKVADDVPDQPDNSK